MLNSTLLGVFHNNTTITKSIINHLINPFADLFGCFLDALSHPLGTFYPVPILKLLGSNQFLKRLFPVAAIAAMFTAFTNSARCPVDQADTRITGIFTAAAMTTNGKRLDIEIVLGDAK
jgi:hypothetical protein